MAVAEEAVNAQLDGVKLLLEFLVEYAKPRFRKGKNAAVTTTNVTQEIVTVVLVGPT